MPKAIVLNIIGSFSTHLELIRRIVEPNSQSKPHITVRYIDILANKDLSAYEERKVSKIEITGVGSFGLSNNTDQWNKTIFLRCEAEEIESIVHKPHYPDSVFHITLYNGRSKFIAESMFSLLEQHPWSFELVFEQKLPLTQIEIKSGFKKELTEYTSDVKALYFELFSERMSRENLISLGEKEVIEKLKTVIQSTAKCSSKFKQIPRKPIQQNLKLDHELDERRIISSSNGSWSKQDKANRNKAGLFLTPPELASSIVEYSLEHHNHSTVDFGDPAIGTGVFFGALNDLSAKKKIDISSAIGMEIDEQRALQTEHKWSKKGLKVIQGDYLHLKNEQKRSLIVANPPYIRFQKIPESYASDLRSKASVVLKDRVSGRAGLYVYFILFSHEWMKESAIASWLIPSEFMETNYGAALRQYFSKQVRLIRIHRFDEKDIQFENAMVTSSVVFFENVKPSSEDICEFTYGGSIKNPNKVKEIKISDLDYHKKWKYHSDLIFAPSDSVRLGDIFDIKRGIATGANKYFILSKKMIDEYKVPAELLLPIIAKAQGLENEVILADEDGIPNNVKNNYVISTQLSREELLMNYPEMFEYIELGDKLKVFDGYLVKTRRHEFLQEFREPAPFMCTYMGRSKDGKPAVKFIKNESNAIATNSFNLLYPKESIFGKKCSSEVLDRLYVTLLKAITLEQIEEVSRTYSGGLKKVEPMDLKNVKVVEGFEWFTPAMGKKLI